MFGRGKPPAPPAQPWALAFLTSDYLVAGLAQPDDYLVSGDDLFDKACNQDGAEAFQLLTLNGVQLQPASNLEAAPETLPVWNLGLCDTLVAVIPNDDLSRQAAQRAYSDYKQPVRGIFYIGAYVISGMFLADPDEGDVLFSTERSLRPMLEATVDCRLPGARLKGWRVPWLLINGRLLHGYQLLP